MAQLNTQPVIKCTRGGCGNYIKVTGLTSKDDPAGEKLQRMLKGLSRTALCEFHRRQRDYYISIGREDDWKAGRP